MRAPDPDPGGEMWNEAGSETKGAAASRGVCRDLKIKQLGSEGVHAIFDSDCVELWGENIYIYIYIYKPFS